MFAACVWLMFYLASPATAWDRNDSPLRSDQLVSWQAGNDHRGTWDIIISCLSTIIACTWSVQHLNVPGHRRDGQWTRWLRSVKWMIITILFPELIVIHAVIELQMAIKALRRMEQKGRPVERPWWLQRPLLSSLVKQLSHSLKRLPCLKQQKITETVDDPKWTLTHCYFANMGGFYFRDSGQSFPLTALQLAHEADFEDPGVTEDEIADKSKQDWFAKTIAALGFLQLALSLIVRTNRGLAFSQLETITLGFAVCGTVIYLFYLYKPQKVDTGIQLKGLNAPVSLQVRTYDSFWDVLMNKPAHESTKKENSNPEIPYRVPNDNIMISENSIAHSAILLLAFASGLFGAMHAIAWHFEFPSTIEKIFWQTATVLAAGSPVVGLITIPFAQWTVSTGDPQLFAGKCLRLLREYSWHIRENHKEEFERDRNKLQVEEAYKRLELCLAGLEAPQPYASIFSVQRDDADFELGPDLLEFLTTTGTFHNLGSKQQTDLHTDSHFIEQFKYLDRLMRGEGSKKLIDTATTNVFPRKNLLPPAVNTAILGITGSVYILARVSLLAIGFSSLRRMPESVYVSTPWTGYIPTLGSSR